jgi:hypothetical protein
VCLCDLADVGVKCAALTFEEVMYDFVGRGHCMVIWILIWGMTGGMSE